MTEELTPRRPSVLSYLAEAEDPAFLNLDEVTRDIRTAVRLLADVQERLDDLEIEKKGLRDRLFVLLDALGLNREEIPELDIAVVKVEPRPRKIWTYPEEIEELAKTLAAEKAYAEQRGTATYTEKPSTAYVKLEPLRKSRKPR